MRQFIYLINVIYIFTQIIITLKFYVMIREKAIAVMRKGKSEPETKPPSK